MDIASVSEAISELTERTAFAGMRASAGMTALNRAKKAVPGM
jgi:hypothetical protein